MRLSSLGDVIQTLPLASAVRRTWPDTKIGWAIDSELADTVTGHPHIDYVHRCNRNQWGRALLNPASWSTVAGEMRSFIREVAAVQYDVAIDAQGFFKSAIIPFAAAIPRRIGFAHGRELSNLFYTEKYISREEYFSNHRHHVEHMLELIRAIGCESHDSVPILPAPGTKSVDKAASVLGEFQRGSPLVALAPFTQWASKRWPPEYWKTLAGRILRDSAANIVIIGTSNERPAATTLIHALGGAAEGRVQNLAGLTTIVDMFALFPSVAVIVAADTAPLHLAAAAGCAHVIGLYGPTAIGRLAPLGKGTMHLLSAKPALPCQPCRERTCRYGTVECMKLIDPEAVFAEVASGLAETSSPRANLPPSE